MLYYDLQLKLANLLAENGLDYNFLAEDIFLYSKPSMLRLRSLNE